MTTPVDVPAPAKHFGKGDPLYVQAQQIWSILTGFVMVRKYPVLDDRVRHQFCDLIAYAELAEIIGRPGSQNTLSRQLGIVGHYCVMNDLPPLNIIVVNKNSELPGDGAVLRKGRTVHDEMRAVGEFNWFSVRPPTVGALRKVYDHHKGK